MVWQHIGWVLEADESFAVRPLVHNEVLGRKEREKDGKKKKKKVCGPSRAVRTVSFVHGVSPLKALVLAVIGEPLASRILLFFPGESS